MLTLYPWLVFIHLLAAFAFVLAHGTSAFVAFRLRDERDPARLGALLDLSSASLGFMYASLMVLVVAGVAAGVLGYWFAQRWPWAALALLFVVTAAMAGYAGPYYQRLRWALGLPSHNQLPAAAKLATSTELDALLRAGRPGRIAVIGGVGLAALLWLMVFKPF